MPDNLQTGQQKRLLNEGPSAVWLGLSDGSHFSDLTGRNYELKGLRLTIDLSHNFRPHSKQSPFYGQICALMRSPESVTLFQIRDARVISGLTKMQPPRDKLSELELIVGNGEVFEYSILNCGRGPGSVYLNIIFRAMNEK
jgi:hypothetical protein